MTRQQLTKPLDKPSQKVIEDTVDKFLADKIIDVVWSKYFYFFSSFEAQEGWDVTSDAGTPVQGSGLTLQTTAVTDNRALAAKFINFLPVMTFDEPSRFRTLFLLDVDTTAADIDYSLSIGSAIPATAGSVDYYGFRLEENELFGVTSDASAETKVKLFETNASQGGGSETFPRIIEARLFPGEKVEFYASPEGGGEVTLQGLSRTNLPSGNSSTSISFDLFTRTTTAKKAFIDFVELIHKRRNR